MWLLLLACLPQLPIASDDTGCAARTLYRDMDRDGFGDPETTQSSCIDLQGWVDQAGDCDDGRAQVHPDADETCDALDRDCDGDPVAGAVDLAEWFPDLDGDGWGEDGAGVTACEAPESHVAEEGDCDDADPRVHPYADEWCDAIDSDCDDDLNDPESLDATLWYPDLDEDEFGDDAGAVSACAAPTEGWRDVGGDCDDSAPAVWPGALEICGDGVVNSCGAPVGDCFPYGEVDLATDATWSAAGANKSATGWALAAGDVTGDGTADLLVGAPERDRGSDKDIGAVLIGQGPLSSAPSLTVLAEGEMDGSRAGAVVLSTDLDGDGVDDLVYQQVHATAAEAGAGEVFVFHGPITGALTTYADWSTSGAAGERTGEALDAPGDLDGDGWEELVLGIPGGEGGAGAAVVLYGPFTVSTARPDRVALRGSRSGGEAGASLAHGDWNGDGQVDLLIGAPGVGVAHLVEGPAAEGSLGDWPVLSGSPDAADAVALGDWDGDGHDDAAVTDADAEVTYVVLGPLSAGGLSASASATIEGDHQDRLGACDQDGDGRSDLLLGDPHADRVTLWLGPLEGTLDQDEDWDGRYSATGVGAAQICVPDVDGDGNLELAFGAESEHRVYLLLGAPGW